MWYRFLITDPALQLFACSLQPSILAPGRQVCISENGLALVVEPGGTIRDLRPGENWDSPWCWADLCDDLLIYRPEPTGPTIVAFRMAEVGQSPTPPVPPVPPIGSDAIKIQEAVITAESPDVRAWPAQARITEFEIRGDGTILLDFTRRNGGGAWPLIKGPEVPPPGEDGLIQYTLWFGAQPIQGDDRWFLVGAILGISRGEGDNYLPTGDMFLTNVDGSGLGQLPKNWYYFAGPPLTGYTPRVGQNVAWFVTAGNQRRDDEHAIAVRSNVIVTPFQVGKWV